MMNLDISDIHFWPIYRHNYAHWFQDVECYDKTLSDSERTGFVKLTDETIEEFKKGLPLLTDIVNTDKNKLDDYHQLNYTVTSVSLFLIMAMMDIMVACKYFMQANEDYEKRFMRGKLRVILNEGFKRLYGFNENSYAKSEWKRLSNIMTVFPDEIKHQHNELTILLEKHSKSSSWWKKDRDPETHLDAELLYISRQEEIVESRVIMDTMKLFSTLMAINNFLTNVNACLVNSLVEKYYRGELRSE